MEVSLEIKGLKELEAALALLPDELQRGALRVGLKDAAEVLKQGMAARAQRAAVHDTTRGKSTFPEPLYRSITYRITITAKKAVAVIGVGRAFWGRFVEHGTRFQGDRPFMAPTVLEDGEQAIGALADGIANGIGEACRRVQARSTTAA